MGWVHVTHNCFFYYILLSCLQLYDQERLPKWNWDVYEVYLNKNSNQKKNYCLTNVTLYTKKYLCIVKSRWTWVKTNRYLKKLIKKFSENIIIHCTSHFMLAHNFSRSLMWKNFDIKILTINCLLIAILHREPVARIIC